MVKYIKVFVFEPDDDDDDDDKDLDRTPHRLGYVLLLVDNLKTTKEISFPGCKLELQCMKKSWLLSWK